MKVLSAIAGFGYKIVKQRKAIVIISFVCGFIIGKVIESHSIIHSLDNSNNKSNKYDPNNVIFKHKEDAERVLNQCKVCYENYNTVTLSDFYEFAGLDGDYDMTHYIIDDAYNAKIVKVSDGYSIVFSEIRHLN